MSRIIIGLTGAFGCGTSFLAENFFAKKGFNQCSLSQILKDKYREKYGKDFDKRRDLQDFGNELRKDDSAMLAKLLDEQVISCDQEHDFVIDSIKNPAEIRHFREKYPEFILVGVFADYDVRWERVKDTYEGSKDTFDADEQKDKGSYEPLHGQRISDCFFESDLILSNNIPISCDSPNEAHKEMARKIDGYLMALRGSLKV